MNTDWLVLGILAVVGGILLIRVLQRIGLVLILIGVLILAGVLGLALLRQSAATQTAAAAATVASAGQTVNGVAVTVLAVLLLLAVLAGAGVIGYLYLRLRRAERRGRWLPGPNAYWGRAGEMQPPAPWWAYMPPPPAWWGYPPLPTVRGANTGHVVIDDEDEEVDLEALPWEEDWGW